MKLLMALSLVFGWYDFGGLIAAAWLLWHVAMWLVVAIGALSDARQKAKAA